MRYLIALLLIFCLNAQAETERCSQKDFDKADVAMDYLTSWKAVADFFSRYHGCDEGYIMEGTSEAVIRLLVDKWERLDELSVLVKNRPALLNEVVDHINETLNEDDVEKVLHNTQSNCFITNKSLCKTLEKAASLTLKWMKTPYEDPRVQQPPVQKPPEIRNYQAILSQHT